jgi:hypothetical protein
MMIAVVLEKRLRMVEETNQAKRAKVGHQGEAADSTMMLMRVDPLRLLLPSWPLTVPDCCCHWSLVQHSAGVVELEVVELVIYSAGHVKAVQKEVVGVLKAQKVVVEVLREALVRQKVEEAEGVPVEQGLPT